MTQLRDFRRVMVPSASQLEYVHVRQYFNRPRTARSRGGYPNPRRSIHVLFTQSVKTLERGAYTQGKFTLLINSFGTRTITSL